MSSMSHNNGVVTTLSDEFVFKSKDYILDDDGGVSGLNHTRA
jgi:hypothetical protein